MKPGFRQRLTILLIALPILALCVPILRVVVANTDMVYPTPVTQSAFLNSYSPASTISRFRIEGSGAQESAPGSSSAGRGCAFHDKEFRSLFVIGSEDEATVMADMERDIKSNVARYGARVVAETGRAPGRFQFDYVAGKSKGSVVVDPIVSLVDPSGLPPGEVAIELGIQITETWYKASEKACQKL
jgi:hypothetical protein